MTNLVYNRRRLGHRFLLGGWNRPLARRVESIICGFNRPQGVSQPRFGMSLLELLVVLTILIAISGIVVATLPGLWKQSQTATTAVNLQQIDSGIRRNLILNRGVLGNRFDSLVVGTGNLSGNIAEYVPNREFFDTTSLADSDIEALAGLGITELVPAERAPVNATFSSHIQQPVRLKGQIRAAILTSAAAETACRELWNIEPDRNTLFLVMGLGGQCSLVGAGRQSAFAEAPMYYPDDRNQDAANQYSRFLVIVELQRGGDRSVARYIGTV
ncbi:MAG TPA: hypothetical protein PKD54_15170, partial [Pirellulaceae bacterium]|nr:hypothetical protein [Pirellulaceae bacterium]